MERREFLVSIFGVSSLLFLKSSNSRIAENSKFVVGDGYDKPQSSLIVAHTTGESASLLTPCNAHEVLKVPNTKGLVLGAAQWHREMYLADSNELTLIKDIKSPDTESFSGHSLFSSNGDYFLTTMIYRASMEGFISIRESHSLRELRRISTYGGNPHQMRWVVQDKIVAVLNSKPSLHETEQNQSVLNFINVQTGEQLRSVATDMGRFTHFSFGDDFKTVVMCRGITPNNLSLFQKINLDNEERLLASDFHPILNAKAEALNHLLVENKSLAVINMIGINKIVFWDYKNNKIVYEKDYQDQPRGIVLQDNKENVFISFVRGNESYINMYRARDFFNFKLEPYASVQSGNGSHLNII